MEIKKTEEEVKKSIDNLLDSIETETTTETPVVEEVVEESKTEDMIEKAEKAPEKKEDPKAHRDENGGNDKMESGSPYQEKQNLEAPAKAAKSKECEEVAEKEAKEEVEEHEDEMHKKDEKKKDKKDDKKAEMKKSIGELTDDEVELVLAWRAQEESTDEIEEEVEKSLKEENEATLAADIKKAVADNTEAFKKSLEERDQIIKSLSEKVEKLSNQPVREQNGIQNLETIEKAENDSVELSKTDVLNKMLELQLSGEGVNTIDIAEFESTGNISNPRVKTLVMESLK